MNHHGAKEVANKGVVNLKLVEALSLMNKQKKVLT